MSLCWDTPGQKPMKDMTKEDWKTMELHIRLSFLKELKTTPCTMYCAESPRHDGGTYLTHFFPSSRGVKFCMDDRHPEPIWEVEVTAGDHNKPGGFWGWWELDENRFTLVWPSRVQLEICFPYGYKAEEDRGRGKFMPVEVKKIRRIE